MASFSVNGKKKCASGIQAQKMIGDTSSPTLAGIKKALPHSGCRADVAADKPDSKLKAIEFKERKLQQPVDQKMTTDLHTLKNKNPCESANSAVKMEPSKSLLRGRWGDEAAERTTHSAS